MTASVFTLTSIFCKTTEQDFICWSNNGRNHPVLLYEHTCTFFKAENKTANKRRANLVLPVAVFDVEENHFAQPASKLAPELRSEPPPPVLVQFLWTKESDGLSTNQGQPKEKEYLPLCCDRAAPIAPLLWKIILNSVKR